jgi:porin
MTHVNNRIIDVQALQNAIGFGPAPVQGSKYVMELYYTTRPTSGLLVRPNIQDVIDPGGISPNKGVLIFGLKTSANF